MCQQRFQSSIPSAKSLSPRAAQKQRERPCSAGYYIGVSSLALYVIWILAGTVAWVSHLGFRAPWLSAFLPARGFPANQAAAGMVSFLCANIPIALIFVLPHSVLTPARLYRIFGRFGRLAYCVKSAATLHFLLAYFTPLSSPVVMELPIPSALHVMLSLSCLGIAIFAFVRDPQTWGLLGVGQALRLPQISSPGQGMDAITWMGVTVWKLCGVTGFILFTGLSILPQQLTLGDCVTRGVAALYLRQRSPAFREWVHKIEAAHMLTWTLRGGLLAVACFTALSQGLALSAVLNILAGAAFMVLVLRLSEGQAAPAAANTGRVGAQGDKSCEDTGECVARAEQKAEAKLSLGPGRGWSAPGLLSGRDTPDSRPRFVLPTVP